MKLFNSFQSMPPKDRQRLMALGLVLLALILWTWNLAPALKTLREVPPQLAQLQEQTQSLRTMQRQAQSFQKSPRLKLNEASLLLQKNVAETLGSGARLRIEGSRATVTLNAVSANSMAQFLTTARTQAQSLPLEAHLQKFKTPEAPQKTTPEELWRGTLILSLPGG